MKEGGELVSGGDDGSSSSRPDLHDCMLSQKLNLVHLSITQDWRTTTTTTTTQPRKNTIEVLFTSTGCFHFLSSSQIPSLSLSHSHTFLFSLTLSIPPSITTYLSLSLSLSVSVSLSLSLTVSPCFCDRRISLSIFPLRSLNGSREIPHLSLSLSLAGHNVEQVEAVDREANSSQTFYPAKHWQDESRRQSTSSSETFAKNKSKSSKSLYVRLHGEIFLFLS